MRKPWADQGGRIYSPAHRAQDPHHHARKRRYMPRKDNTPPSTPQPGTPPPSSGEQPLLTQRGAIVFLAALVIALLLGVLTYLQTHNAAAAGIAVILGFGGTLAITNKIIH